MEDSNIATSSTVNAPWSIDVLLADFSSLAPTSSTMSTCTLCPDGSPPSLPEALVELRTSAGMRSIPCSDIADYMLTLEELDTCLLLRMTASQECGCEPFLCNPAADICPFRGDGVCGNNNSAACRNDHSDCVDCDPCSELSYTSCTNCTAAPYGCFWCPYNGVCSSYAPLEQSLLGSTSTMPACGMDDFVGLLSTCNETSSVFSDPLFSANQWAYDLINIEPVWREGITGAGVRVGTVQRSRKALSMSYASHTLRRINHFADSHQRRWY